jgi:hypothetical protein
MIANRTKIDDLCPLIRARRVEIGRLFGQVDPEQGRVELGPRLLLSHHTRLAEARIELEDDRRVTGQKWDVAEAMRSL